MRCDCVFISCIETFHGGKGQNTALQTGKADSPCLVKGTLAGIQNAEQMDAGRPTGTMLENGFDPVFFPKKVTDENQVCLR